MSNLLEHVTNQENLCWAWLKTKRMYESDDLLTDDLEVADFEMRLKESLTSIAEDLKSGTYKLQPLIPLAHPKGRDDSQNHRIRQFFKVAVRDQVAWIAVVNIIGPTIEERMPSWSYGNRLYRQLWFEPGAQGYKHLRFGHFRHAKGQLYRPFHQTWPVYRRHILFTARKMTGDRIVLDDRDDELLKTEMELQTGRLSYLIEGWWQHAYPEAYWATIDFRQFYPNVSLEVVRSNLCRFCDYADGSVASLVDQLLFFPLERCDWSDADLGTVCLDRKQKAIDGIPTGLFVSGFLANVAMLEIDSKVDTALRSRQVAQFRYVDDHTLLAPTYDALNDWMDEYLSIVKKSGLGAEINSDKTEPAALKEYRIALQQGENGEDLKSKAVDATRIDIRMPTPFLTKTLAKVSMIARVEIDLQTLDEQDSLLADIEQLLLTEFPTEELRPVTRMSFAMSQLCKVAAKRFLHSKETWKVEEEIAGLIDSYTGKERPVSPKLRKLQSNRDRAIEKQFSRLFEFLEMTLERCPDRPRLWAKALRFCLSTGYAPGLGRLFDLLRRIDDLHSLSKEYMWFFILQRITRYFIQAVSTIISPDRPLCQRSAAVRFANACYKVADKIQFHEHDHSNVLRLYSECRSMYLLLSRCVRSRRRVSYDLEEAYIFLYQQGLLTTLPLAKKTIPDSTKKKQQGEVAAHWYVDSRITPFAAMRPSFYWRSIAPELTPGLRGDSLLLGKWPRFLTARPRTYFLQHLNDAPAGRLGWFADILAATTESAISTKFPATRRLSLGSGDSANYMTLNDWVRFVENLPQWDPRRSEWTALEIVSQVLDSRLSFGGRDQKRVSLIPQNILVPIPWKDSRSGPSFHTWESWDQVSRNSAWNVHLRSSHPIEDDRYSLLWQNSRGPLDPWEDVYSSCLVLLGLLRLSFDLPCSWNPEGQLRLWSKGTGRILTELPCSSRTLAILQATVLPRNRETFILRSLDQRRFCLDDDTVNDPPEIPNLDVLKNLLKKSQQILERYRVTVQGHKPRQLIPLSLDQIGKALFEDTIGEEE